MPLPRHAFFRGHIVPYSQARIGVMTHALHDGTPSSPASATGTTKRASCSSSGPRDHFRRFLESAHLLGMELPHSKRASRRPSSSSCELFPGRLLRPAALRLYADEQLGVRLHGLDRLKSTIMSMPYGRYLDNEENLHRDLRLRRWRTT